jgi:NhaP-type Na+/H+ or K+/H+ antiporter
VKAQSNLRLLGRSLFATLIAAIVGPILWIVLTPMFGSDPDAVLYALGLSILICIGAYMATVSVSRRWSR